MNYIDWDIIEDNFTQAKKDWDNNLPWVLVDCKVKTLDGNIHNWCLHFDEYMLRKISIELKNKENMNLEELNNKLQELQNWQYEIQARETAEEEAGEDL